MGEVRRAKDMSLQRPVAVKTLISDLSGAGEEWKQKLRAEAMTVAGVHHPNIVDIYEIVEEDGVLHLVFEYVEGQTVHGVLAARGRLNAADCARILVPVCAALELAHSRGLVHRDLKPANVMITSTGHVKLMDFGIARPVGQRVKKEDGKPGASGLLFDRTTTVVGTPVYMAPEAERGMVGPACDVFSLGACLYEMLTGARPFRADATAYDKMEMIPPRPSALAPGVPEAVDKLVSAALSPDPSARPSVTQFARLLVEGARDVKDGGLTPPVSPVAK
jgi:serine/threonine protein kinase